eukprot:6033826-Alexandrium_andersonii.AAC.1
MRVRASGAPHVHPAAQVSHRNDSYLDYEAFIARMATKRRRPCPSVCSSLYAVPLHPPTPVSSASVWIPCPIHFHRRASWGLWEATLRSSPSGRT